ncbi:MAG: hypothetical protein HOD17_12355 [Desulfobacteraceae bacterium]|nr:hypothetical protein [Desulfobacteraceae bacterium]
MKQLQIQLKSIAKALTSLAKKVETASKQIEKLQAKPAAKKKKTVKKAAPKKKIVKKKIVKKKIVKKKIVKKTVAKKKAAPAKKKAGKAKESVIDKVFDVIKRSKKGIDNDGIKKKTGFDSRQVSNAIYKLTKKGDIKTAARGMYVKK